MNKNNHLLAIIFSLLILLAYSSKIIFDKNDNISSINNFLNKNPQYLIEYRPYKYIEEDFILTDSTMSTHLTVIIDSLGCLSCVKRESEFLRKY